MIATLNNISLPLNPIDTSAKISKLLKLVPLTKVMLIMVSFINKGAKRNLLNNEKSAYIETYHGAAVRSSRCRKLRNILFM